MNNPRFRFSSRLRSGLLAAALTLAPAAQASAGVPLMPMPRSFAATEGALRIEGLPAVQAAGCANPVVASALARFERDLGTITGMALQGPRLTMTIRCAAHDPAVLSLEAREGYRLDVKPGGIVLEADGETGVLRGLATLRQAITRDAKGPIIPGMRVDDAPRFPWRSLMIDTARHFMTVPTIKRQIDAMEMAKLNVLHLHLSDNEAFRVESRRFPRLTQVAAPGGYYTQADIRELVRYAGERGIRVVPEFDIPGHNLALLSAYSELGVAPIAPDDPLRMAKGALNPAAESTYTFLKTFFAEMTPLFPDRYFHIGGDEVSDAAWRDSAEVEAFKRKRGMTSKHEVETYFHDRVRRLLAAHGKSTIGWDEIADGTVPKDVIVEAWRTSNPVATATAKGNRVIVSAGYYLSQLMPAETIYAIDPLDPNAYATMSKQELALVRRNPASAALVSDGLAPEPQPPLTPEQEKLVLGGDAPLWAETISDEVLDSVAWPRALAIGERFWSPASLRDPDDLYRRMVPAMDRLRALGLQDLQHRHRMLARLAPDAPEVVGQLIDVTAPVRMFARAKLGAFDPIELADASSADSTVARRFRVAVSDYLAGDRSRQPLLKAELSAWRDNAPAFAAAASGRPLLEAAIPTAQDVAALGTAGLAAIEAIDQRRALDGRTLSEARALVAKLKAFEDASKDLMASATQKQPPAELIVIVWPDVSKLVEAAAAKR